MQVRRGCFGGVLGVLAVSPYTTRLYVEPMNMGVRDVTPYRARTYVKLHKPLRSRSLRRDVTPCAVTCYVEPPLQIIYELFFVT